MPPGPPAFEISGGGPAAACWAFNVADARPLLDAGVTGRNAACGQDELERFLARIRIEAVSDAALLLFDLPQDRAWLMTRPIGSVWPEAGLVALSDLLASLANPRGDPVQTREIDCMEGLIDVVLTGSRPADARSPDLILVSIRARPDPRRPRPAIEAGRRRRHSLISSIPVPLWEIDAQAGIRVFRRLRAEGVTDLEAYLGRRPDLVDLICDIVAVTEANRDAVELMGAADPSQLVRPIGYLFSMARESARRVMIARFAGARNHVEQAKIRTFDGRVRDVLLLMTFPAPDDPFEGSLIMMIDNTARIEAEARLRQMEADFSHAARLSTLGQMTASIAHEIRQPLSAILTNAETSLRWLAKADPNVPKVTQLVERVTSSARRAGDIIARIQDMAGKRQPQHVRLDLNEVIWEALNFVRHDSEERSIHMHLDLAADLPPMLGERVQLQQIVVNLLVNSAQALEAVAPDKREIRVRTFRDGPGWVAFSIRDTGPGIPPEDLNRIFGGFFSTREGGMGIGLTICQSIVAAHGGTIAAASPPGQGAEFTVVLPAAPAELEQPDATPGHAGSSQPRTTERRAAPT